MRKLMFLAAFIFILCVSLLSDFVPVTKASEPVVNRDCFYPEVGRGFCQEGNYLVCWVDMTHCYAMYPV